MRGNLGVPGISLCLERAAPCARLGPVMLTLLQEFNRVVEALQATRIRYALAGGLAVAVHGGVRSTEDIDFLVHPDDVSLFVDILKALGYRRTKDPWTFPDTQLTLHRLWIAQAERQELLMVDLLAANTDAHKAMIERAQSEQWARGTLRTLQKTDLVQMKKARMSMKDRADIELLESGDGTQGKQG